MAASTLIRFDTTPPTVTVGQAIRVGDDIRVPFTVDEIAVVEATGSVPGGGDVTVVVDPDEIIVLDPPSDAAVIELTITATDDVDNQSVAGHSVVLVRLDLDFPLTLTIEPTVERFLQIEPAVRELSIEPTPRTLTIEDNARTLTVEPTVLRELTIEATALRTLGVSETVSRSLTIQATLMRTLTIREE